MKNLTILVVEDDHYDFEITNRRLRYVDGIQHIIHFSDGEEMLEYIFRTGIYTNNPDSTKPDLILLDISLPRLNGQDVLKKIKNEGNDEIKRIPVIMLATLAESNAIKEITELGAAGYLLKPLQTDYFLDLLIKLHLI